MHLPGYNSNHCRVAACGIVEFLHVHVECVGGAAAEGCQLWRNLPVICSSAPHGEFLMADIELMICLVHCCGNLWLVVLALDDEIHTYTVLRLENAAVGLAHLYHRVESMLTTK